MPYDISTTERLAPGRTLAINDRTGINILAPATGQTVVSFNNAGTILVNSDSPYLVAGFNYDYNSQSEGSVFTNEATGVFRVVSTGGQNGTMGFTSVWGQTGWTGEFINHGTFEVEATAWAMGISTFNQGLAVTNTGRFVVRSETNAFAVYANYGASVINSGLIEATGPFASAIRSIDRPSDVFNSGTIRAVTTGTEGWGIGIGLGGSGPDVSHIDNSGLIEAQYAILDETDWSFWPAVQIVTNSGRIVGMIDLARGDDTLINSGSITGEVWLGYGTDVYDGRGGTHVGAVHGSFGNDVLTGGDGADVLFGEDGDDVISGGAGNDFLQGGRGDNVIDGGTGIDTLIYAGLTRGVDLDLAAGTATAAGRDQISGIENVYGSIWADHLRGDAGSNLLFGSDGADILDGRGGADTLVGGAGADTLTGGDGDDTFVFGTGDGADVITDLSTGDRLVIHGYTGSRQTVQVGADVRITLSDTDSILLRNTTVSAVVSQTTFNTTPRPAYNAAGEAPELLGLVHVEIRDRFVIVEGETVVFDQGNGGLAVYGEITADAGVTNGGHITNSGNQYGASGIGLGGFNHGSNFDNLASGLLSVTSTHAGTEAVGVTNTSYNATVTNAGRIDVRAVYSAYGVRNQTGTLSLSNTGTIHVESQGATIGAMTSSVTNDGLIEAFGGTFTFGTHSQFGRITNHGTITAGNTTGDAVGIFLKAGVIVNTGLIQADRAIYVEGSSSGDQILLDNSGEIRGTILLSRGQDRVVNTGVIDGVINLDEGDDSYDGSGGRQTAQVNGGAGQDRLTGSAYADHLTGGEGADTLRGGGGNDLLDGGEGDDFAVFSGLQSDYSWTIDGDTITITGPDGIDTLVGIELLRFADGLVSLTGRGINARGSGENDTIVGCELDDVLDGGAVPPLFEMQGSTDNGEDRLFGLAGNDVLTGGGRADYLDGGTGDDQLDGGLGNDTLLGGEGNDQLTGGKGSDTLDGGNGMDVAIFTGALADFQIVTVNGVTTVTGPDGVDRSNRPLTAVDVLTNIERLQFSDQVLDLRPNLVVGSSGDDVLTGSSGTDSLVGGDGDDELSSGLGDDWIDGGSGWDTFVVQGDIADYRVLVVDGGFLLKGAEGTDHLTGVEFVRFSGGGGIDLARQYGAADPGAQTLPTAGDKADMPAPPQVLPGTSQDDDAFVILPDLGTGPQGPPDVIAFPTSHVSSADLPIHWTPFIDSALAGWWPGNPGIHHIDGTPAHPETWDMLA